MPDKKYVGNGKTFGEFNNIKIGLKANDLPEPNDRGYINLIIGEKKDEPGEYWVAIDDWKPE